MRQLQFLFSKKSIMVPCSVILLLGIMLMLSPAAQARTAYRNNRTTSDGAHNVENTLSGTNAIYFYPAQGGKYCAVLDVWAWTNDTAEIGIAGVLFQNGNAVDSAYADTVGTDSTSASSSCDIANPGDYWSASVDVQAVFADDGAYLEAIGSV